MKWADFAPYVMPHVLGCPVPVLVHHARLASIEFFRRTNAFTRTLDAVYTYGQPSVDIEGYDSETSVSRVLAVTVDGREFDLIEPRSGMALLRDDSRREFAFTQDMLTLTINPLQARRLPVVIDAALVPSLTSLGLNDDVARLYVSDIATGVISSIQRLPGQKFTNAGEAELNARLFEHRISTTCAKVQRGSAASRTRPQRHYC